MTTVEQRRSQIAKFARSLQEMGQVLAECVPSEPDDAFSDHELCGLLAGIIKASLAQVLATSKAMGISSDQLADATARVIVLGNARQDANKSQSMM